MSEQTTEITHVLSVPSENAMLGFLGALNVSGKNPELPCSGSGAPFLATLTDPDADRVHIIRSGSSGFEHCCHCSHEGGECTEFTAGPWPTYPVLALVTEWPDEERINEEDYIDPWWREQRPTARLAAQVCTDPACTIPRKPGRPMHGPHDFRAASNSVPPGASS